MPLIIIREDITRVRADAVVSPSGCDMLPGGGVSAALYAAGDAAYRKAVDSLQPCAAGEVRVTRGAGLSRYVIHAAGPVWQDGLHGEPGLLATTCRNALQAALDRKCRSLAMPLLSAGAFGFPKETALQILFDTVQTFLRENDLQVTLAVFERGAYLLGRGLAESVEAYIDDTYVEEHRPSRRNTPVAGGLRAAKEYREQILTEEDASCMCAMPAESEKPRSRRPGILRSLSEKDVMRNEAADTILGAMPTNAPRTLEEALRKLDESFSQALLRLIDEKGMTDVECYKRANIDRKLFSKIRSSAHYRPSKQTALAFAIALRLTLPETEALLRKAGHAISHSDIGDVIVEYFLRNGEYDIDLINRALFDHDQALLGS